MKKSKALPPVTISESDDISVDLDAESIKKKAAQPRKPTIKSIKEEQEDDISVDLDAESVKKKNIQIEEDDVDDEYKYVQVLQPEDDGQDGNIEVDV